MNAGYRIDPQAPTRSRARRRRRERGQGGLLLLAILAILIAFYTVSPRPVRLGWPLAGAATLPLSPPAGANVALSGGPLGLTTSMPAINATRWTGTATWYCSDGRHGSPRSACPRGHRPSELIGAIDRKDSPFRKGDRVTVRSGGKAVTVRIVDVCACGGARLIDLSIAAFERLSHWGAGVIPVTIERAGRSSSSSSSTPRARLTLPPTDMEP